MSFGSPAMLLLLLGVGLMGYAVWRLLRWRQLAQRAFAGPQASHWRAAALWPRLVLVLLGAALIVTAAALPRWGSRELQRERVGVDLVIVLDISQSMLATDAPPSRLALAQDELVRLIESERGNRFGLVVFAGTPILRSPLTTDTQAIIGLIRRADQEGGLVRVGSDLGAALQEAGRILEGSESNGKAVLLVSDGEDHADSFPGLAAAMRGKGIAVYTAGVGTLEGSTIRETDVRGQPRLKLDAQGRPVVTRLNDSSLRAIAAEGGGRYVHLDGSGNTLLGVRGDLAGLEQTPLGEETERLPIERYQAFVAAALIALAGAWFLPARLGVRLRLPARAWKPSPGAAVLLLALLVGACGGDGDSVEKRNQAGNRLYEAGQFEPALQAYQELLSRRPDLPELSVNAGNALHRLQRYDRAVAETQRALPPQDAVVGAVTFYNLGNHLLALGELPAAFDAYVNALLLDPGDPDAKHNLELTLLLLAQQQEEQAGGPSGGEPQPREEGMPEASGQPGDQPQPNAQGQGEPQPSPAQVQRDLREALAGLDETLTFEQAVRILDLLREQQRQQRTGQPGSSTGPDY